jgi:hypothetical protein
MKDVAANDVPPIAHAIIGRVYPPLMPRSDPAPKRTSPCLGLTRIPHPHSARIRPGDA